MARVIAQRVLQPDELAHSAAVGEDNRRADQPEDILLQGELTEVQLLLGCFFLADIAPLLVSDAVNIFQ